MERGPRDPGHAPRRDFESDVERELARLEPPRARPEFAERLREAFVSGRLAEERAFRERLRERFVRGDLERRPARGRLLRWAVPAAAAALLLVTLVPLGLGDALRWEVLEVGADAEILGEIAAWQEIHTGRERLRLSYGEDVFVEIGADSRVERSAREDGRVLSTERGSLVFSALPGDGPIRFVIETPDAIVEVRSDAVGVDVYPEGTCVCVVAGEVVVTPRVGEAEHRTVGPGRSCFVKRAGGVVEHDVPDAHGAPVRELMEFARL